MTKGKICYIQDDNTMLPYICFSQTDDYLFFVSLNEDKCMKIAVNKDDIVKQVIQKYVYVDTEWRDWNGNPLDDINEKGSKLLHK